MVWLLAAVLWAPVQDAPPPPEEVRWSSRAYHAPAPHNLHAEARLVEIQVTVRDKQGQLIEGLNKEDFQVLDNGIHRPLTAFYVNGEPPTPLAQSPRVALPVSQPVTRPQYLALYIDDVNGQDEGLSGGLRRTQAAAEKFIRAALPTGVHIGIFTASGALTQDFTTNEEYLLKALSLIEPHPSLGEGGVVMCPRVTPYFAYKIAYQNDPGALTTVLRDALIRCPQRGVNASLIRAQAEETWERSQDLSVAMYASMSSVIDRLGKMPGSRELLVASSGFLPLPTHIDFDAAVANALRQSVVVNALDVKGLYTEPPAGSRLEDSIPPVLDSAGPIAEFDAALRYESIEMPFRLDATNQPLSSLAEATGGAFRQSNNDILAEMIELGQPPELTYQLVFLPDGILTDGALHKLKITLPGLKGHYVIQARSGYYAPDDRINTQSLRAKIDRAVLADDTKDAFPVAIGVQQVRDRLTVTVGLNVDKLRFIRDRNRARQRITLTSALLDQQGRIVAAKESTMELALTDASFARYSTQGLAGRVTFDVPAGTYQLRQVVHEGVDGRLDCSTHTVQVK